MRRARISIKPNVRPGGRSVGPSAEDKSGQDSTAGDDTQKTVSPSPQSQPEVKESAEAIGDGHFPGSPTEKAALNTDSKDRAPSSAKITATPALQRRSRFSVAPNLSRPKLRSTADPPPPPPSSAGKTASLPLQSSKTSSPIQAAKSFPQPPVPVAISGNDSQNSKFSGSTAAAHCPPSSPCLPSTSGCPESPSSASYHRETCKSPLKIPSKDVGLLEGATPASYTHSPYVKLSRVDGPGSPLRDKIFSDKERVLRALKLKELMKMERTKETMRWRGRHKHEHVYEMDHDKMTLADFIYYIPDTNPMTSSLSKEETQTTPTTTAITPSPTVQKSMAEADEGDDDDDADDDMLVPKVRVAEDGSLILDEESLTVRVQRTSDTVVDNTHLLFERGSTTTYSSFRKNCYVKSWSVRETDMFYLAISMVGTDFTMMAQLLTHRNRTEIKSKFKKEEKENGWRVDKAFREKRPYDAEFFSFLLKRILAKDKEKGSTIKLVVKSSKTKRAKGKGGKKAKEIVEDFMSNDDCDELCSVDSVSFDLEKENEDCSNFKEADVPSGKKRKCKKDKPCGETSKPRKTARKGKCSIEDEDLVCVDSDLVEVDTVDADNEDQSCMPVLKKKRKRSKKDDQEGQKEKADPKEKRQKKNKKTLKVQNEECADGESEAVNEEHSEVSTIPNKKRKRSKTSVKEDEEHTKRKPKTKKSKTSQQDCSGPEPGAEGSEVSTAAASAEGDHGEKLDPDSAAQEKISKSSSKHSKRALPKLVRRKSKKFTEPKEAVEMENAVEDPEDESCTDSGNKSRILRLAEEQLQNQPVVVLERTPPRFKDSHNSSESQDGPQSSKSPQCSPERQMRAEKVKRNLSATDGGSKVHGCEEDHRKNLNPEAAGQEAASQSCSRRSPRRQTREAKVKPSLTSSEKEKMDQSKTRSDSSAEDMSNTAMPDQMVSQDCEVMDADQCMEEEGFNLQSLTSSEVNGQTLLKRAVVSVSHEEVQHYLRVQAQNTAEESTASESLQDTTPDRGQQVHPVGESFEEQGSSSVTVSQEAEMKEPPTATVSAQQSVTATRRRVLKPTPSLSRAAQSSRRPVIVQTTELSQNTSSLKDQVKLTPNENIEKQHRDRPEEEDISSLPPQENSPRDVKDDVRTSANDAPSITSVGIPQKFDKPMTCNTDIPERRTELDASPAQVSEDEDQIRDQEEQDSESKITEITIKEVESEIKRIIPVSFPNDKTPSQFAKPTTSIDCVTQVMVNPEQTSGPNEDSADKPHHQSSVIAQHCDLNQDKDPFSGEDKLVSSVVDLLECKQDEDLLFPVPLLSSTQTPVPVDHAGTEIKQQNNPVFSDASLVPFEPQCLDSSFCDHPTQYTNNMYDADTMMFSVPAAENIQIPDKQDSAKQDCTVEQSSVSENWSVPLDGNSKTEISNSSGVETGASDDQAEEPTFILTLYEIPTSQLFSEGISGQQDTLPYELQPAQVHTPSLFKGNSQSPFFTEEPSSASLHMASEEPEKPCEGVSHEDDPLVPLSKDSVDASIQLISSQESSYDGVNSLISPSEMFSSNSAMLTDVPMDEIPTKISETKDSNQKRNKIKIKPKLKPCAKAGPSRNLQLDHASSQSLLSSHAKAETETKSKQKTSAQETIDPKIHSNPEDSELRAHPGCDSVVLITALPVSEEMTDDHPLRIEDDQMDEDLPVHSTVMEVSKDTTDDCCEGVSHMVLADAFMLSSGEIDSVFNKELESPNDSELQKEREKAVLEVVNEKEKMADIAEKQDTCQMTSSVLPSTSQEKSKPFRRGKLSVKPKIPKQISTNEDLSSQEQSDIGFNDPATAQIISPASLIKEELEERTEREDVSEEELDARPTIMTLSTQDLTSFTSEKSLSCSDSSSVEMKIEGGHEDVAHTVLSDIFVPVSNEAQEDVNVERGCSVQGVHQIGEEERQSLERVCHVLLTDILRSPRLTERAQVREESQSSHVESLVSPERNRPAQGKGKVLVNMTFPKMKILLDSPNSGERSHSTFPTTLKSEQDSTLKTECITETKLASTQCSAGTFTSAELLPIGSEGCEEACGGVSHMVLADVLVPVLDEAAEQSLVNEASSAALQENAAKKSTSTERQVRTETEEMTASQSVSGEWKTPSCRRGTLCPKPTLSKRINDPSETDLHPPGSAQSSLATPQQSLDHQAEEWTFKSNMLPMNSDEIENWCEGVSHMLLSDAFVPVSEEIEENSTNLKVFVSSSPRENEEFASSPSMRRNMPSVISDKTHPIDTTTDIPEIEVSNKSLPPPQAKESPTSTFHMTLRSPERCLKDQPHVLKSSQGASTTPQRTRTLKMKESVESPSRQHIGETSSVCRVQLERLSVEEICAARSVLQPKHHSTPVTVKTTARGNETHKVSSLAFLGSRSPGFELQADEETHVPPGYSPKIVLHRIPVTATNALTSMPTLSPARAPTASRTSADQQSPQNSPSAGVSAKDPVQVSQFFLDDIFTEVVDPD